MGSYEAMNDNQMAFNGFHITRRLGGELLPSWFDVKVFYFRISSVMIDDSAPESLTLNHIPLDPDTLLEVNGTRCGINSDGISSLLRRDRVDKKAEEVTFVSTDAVNFTGSVKFEVLNRDNLVLSGVLELCSINDANGEQIPEKKWSLRCDTKLVARASFLKAHRNGFPEYAMPVIEVSVAGCFSGAPIILTETLQLNTCKKNSRKSTLNAIPEHETTETRKNAENLNAYPYGFDLQVPDYISYKIEDEEDLDFYWSGEYKEDEDGELSWFNAGLRVGVGVSLGVCLGVGLGVGLLLRTYQTTTRTFRRRFL